MNSIQPRRVGPAALGPDGPQVVALGPVSPVNLLDCAHTPVFRPLAITIFSRSGWDGTLW